MRHVKLSWLLVCALSACSGLRDIPGDVCGNGAVDPGNGEDCDSFADPALGAGTHCAPAGAVDQCHYTCGAAASGAPCPDGWGCGQDGLCRRASGRFALAPRSPIPPTFGNLSMGDVDGDGVPDVVSGDYDGLKVRFGTREGDYSHVIGVSLTMSNQADPVLGNFDGTGGNDLAFVDPDDSVLIAATAGADQSLRPAPFPARDLTGTDGASLGTIAYVPMAVDAGRLQQLLRVELREDGASFGFLDGGATLEQAVPHDLSFVSVQVPLRLPVGNVDADPADELVVAIDGETKVRVYGAGVDGAQAAVLAPAVEVTFPGPLFNTGVDLADVNGDGKLDLIGVYRRPDGSFGVSTALGNGLGAFAAPPVAGDPRFDAVTAFFSGDPFNYTRPFLLCGDVNGDKRADFLVGNADDTTLSYLYYRGIIYLNGAAALTDVDRLFFLDAVSGDVNRDGNADFVLATESGLDVRKGSPTGLLSQHFVPTGQFPAALKLADFDGDRFDDVAFVEGMRGPEGPLPFEPDLLRVAYGGAALPPSEPVSVAQWNEIKTVAPAVLGGLSQDATRDLAVNYADGDGNRWLAELRGRGDRTFLAPLDVGFYDPLLVTGRFEHAANAHTGLLVLDSHALADDSPMPPMLMRGGVGGFVLDRAIQTSSVAEYVVPDCATFRRASTAVDLDGDGADEAVVAYQCDDGMPLMVTVVRTKAQDGGAGSGGEFIDSLETMEVTSAGHRPFRMMAGDVDGDGKEDVVLTYGGDALGYEVLWNGMLAGGSESATDVPLASVTDVALVNADFDAAKEIAVLTSGRVLVSKVTVGDDGVRTVQPARPTIELGGEASRLLVGDINRDGLDDLIAFPEVYFATPFDPATDTPPDGGGGGGGGGGGDECAGGCDLAAQSCCGDGATCDLVDGALVCRSTIGGGMETTECTTSDDCAAGYSCIGVLLLGRSECLPWCDSHDDCVGPGGACDLAISAGGTVVPGAVTCTPNCNPDTSEGCPAGWGCHVYQRNDDSGSETLCAPAGSGTQGATCSKEDECAPGFTCVTSLSQCLQNCQFAPDGGECPAGLACGSYTNHPVVGGVEWGQCL
jgi:hypothetical protein